EEEEVDHVVLVEVEHLPPLLRHAEAPAVPVLLDLQQLRAREKAGDLGEVGAPEGSLERVRELAATPAEQLGQAPRGRRVLVEGRRPARRGEENGRRERGRAGDRQLVDLAEDSEDRLLDGAA